MITTAQRRESPMAKKKTGKNAPRKVPIDVEELQEQCDEIARYLGGLRQILETVSGSEGEVEVYGAGFFRRGMDLLDKYKTAIRKGMIDAELEDV